MTETSPRVIVHGLDWFGAAKRTYSGEDAGSFYVVTVPPVNVRPSELGVKLASTVGITTAPVFRVSGGETGKLTVNFGIRVAGAFPITITFRGQPLSPSRGDRWMLYSHDASTSLTEYIPGYPTPSYSSWSLSDVEVRVQGNMLNFLSPTGLESEFRGKRWVGVGWTLPSLNIGHGLALVYRVRWNSSTSMSLKMNMPSLAMISDYESLVLRSNGQGFDWAIYNDKTKLSVHQNSSKIDINGMWHDIFIFVSGNFLRVYEDGRNVLATARSSRFLGAFDVVCETEGRSINVDLMDFRTCPVAPHNGVPEFTSTSKELIFNLASRTSNTKYFFVQSFGDSIVLAYTDTGLCFSASNQLTQMGYCASSNYLLPLRPYSVIQYRFMVVGDGCEAKITIAGNIILSINKKDRHWQWYSGSGFTKLSEYTTLGNGVAVSVLVVVSPGLLTLFEDGEFSFELVLDPPSPAVNTWATFNVQIEKPSPRFVVQLSHLRIVSGLD